MVEFNVSNEIKKCISPYIRYENGNLVAITRAMDSSLYAAREAKKIVGSDLIRRSSVLDLHKALYQMYKDIDMI